MGDMTTQKPVYMSVELILNKQSPYVSLIFFKKSVLKRLDHTVCVKEVIVNLWSAVLVKSCLIKPNISHIDVWENCMFFHWV
jgi:hypothetical protein